MSDKSDLKELKKLAAACRKAGIKHYKSASGMEFTLSDDFQEPVRAAKGTKQAPAAPQAPTADTLFKGDAPSEEDLLFWSVGAQPDGVVDQKESEAPSK